MPRALLTLLGLALLAACATGAGDARPLPERTADLSMHDFMKQVIDPAANTVFAAGNEEDAAPSAAEADAKWKAVVEAAGVLQESGRLLLVPARARDDAEWRRTAQLMADSGAEAAAAAAARDVDAAFEAGGKLYDSCNGCHARFIHGRI
jgi:hypothetical protein